MVYIKLRISATDETDTDTEAAVTLGTFRDDPRHQPVSRADAHNETLRLFNALWDLITRVEPRE